MESFYRAVHGEGRGCGEMQFPSAYPTGVLLGCVEVADCLQVMPAGWALPLLLRSSLALSAGAQLGWHFCAALSPGANVAWCELAG